MSLLNSVHNFVSHFFYIYFKIILRSKQGFANSKFYELAYLILNLPIINLNVRNFTKINYSCFENVIIIHKICFVEISWMITVFYIIRLIKSRRKTRC
jgi:hypothetical protein